MARTVALTGVTGFIGGAIADGLLTCGWRVRALVRPGRVCRWTGDDVDIVWGTLEDPRSRRALVGDVEAVVHCAGAIRGSVRAHFVNVNTEATARLAEVAAAQEPQPRFVLLSSLAAREPQLSDYAASKRGGEEALLRVANGMLTVILRPPAVYGPGDRALGPLFRCLARGIAPRWGADQDRFSLLYVDDLVRAVAACLDAEHLTGLTFELHDGKIGGYSWAELVDIAETVCGKRISRIRVPGILLDVFARLNVLAGQTLGYHAMLTPGKLRELRHSDWTCDNNHFSDATGWVPRIAFDGGFHLTLGTPIDHSKGVGPDA